MQHPEAVVSQPEQGYFSPLKAVKMHFLQIYTDEYTPKPLRTHGTRALSEPKPRPAALARAAVPARSRGSLMREDE